MFTAWCSHCIKGKRKEEKEKKEEEEKRQKEVDAAEQNRIFEEARRRMMEQEHALTQNYLQWFYYWPSAYYRYSHSNNGLNDDSINVLAKEKSLKYISSKENQENVSYEDAFLVHKINMTSTEMLVAKL